MNRKFALFNSSISFIISGLDRIYQELLGYGPGRMTFPGIVDRRFDCGKLDQALRCRSLAVLHHFLDRLQVSDRTLGETV